MVSQILSAALPILSLLICLGFAYFCRKSIQRHAIAFYIGSILLTLFVFWISQSPVLKMVHAQPGLSFLYNLFKRGSIGTSLFIIVMFIGAVKPTSWLRRNLQPIRGRLSIIAGIFVLLHNVIYGKFYFMALFLQPQRLAHYQLIATLLSLAAIFILIPLFVTSFISIRRRMQPDIWKRLQRWAYVFFPLIIAHVLVLYYAGLHKALQSGSPRVSLYIVGTLFYIIVYGTYAVLKWRLSKKTTPVA